MSLGQIFFAWANSTETTFGAEHHIADDPTGVLGGAVIFSLKLEHSEGDSAVLSLEIRNPRVGLLATGRKSWAWLAYDAGASVIPLFFGRLVSVPANMQEEVITLQFVAKPLDMLARKRALATTLQQAPWWDPAFLDSARRTDPDTLLEGYSALWHIDPVTHDVTISDYIVGEDGVAEFTEDDVFYDGVQISIDKAPLGGVQVEATVTWTQFAVGTVDIGKRVFGSYSGDGFISDWPKPLASLGNGYTVAFSLALDVGLVSKWPTDHVEFQYQNEEKKHRDGDTLSISESLTGPSGGIGQGGEYIISTYTSQTGFVDTIAGTTKPAKLNYSGLFVPFWVVYTELALRYEAKRERQETVRFLLTADLQPVFTDAGDETTVQDIEFLQLNAKVGPEGPYGTFKGEWTAGANYFQYDIFTVDNGTYAYQVTRDHFSAATFDAEGTRVPWQANKRYVVGEHVTSGGVGYQVLMTHTSAGAFSPTTLLNTYLVYGFSSEIHEGSRLYQSLSNFRGDWRTATPYRSGEMVVAPDGNWYRVNEAHISGATFEASAVGQRGGVLYAMLLNPPPIGDLSRRSYFPTERGRQSLEHLIARARAHLIQRSRVARVSWDASFVQVAQTSLRMNATIEDARLPGGGAIGKVISRSLTANGDQGLFIGSITIGCAVGQGSELAAEGVGTPEYVTTGYVTAGYQSYTGAVTALGSSDVTYTPAADRPIDDGLVFPLSRRQVVVSEAFHAFSSAQQLAILTAVKEAQPEGVEKQSKINKQAAQLVAESLTKTPVWYTLTLASLQNGPFSSDYDIVVSPLSIPMQIDLGS